MSRFDDPRAAEARAAQITDRDAQVDLILAFADSHSIKSDLGDAVRALACEVRRLRERKKWWQKNAEDIAKERADAWTALAAVEALFQKDMPAGPEGQRVGSALAPMVASPEYREAYRLLLASLKDRDALRSALTPST